MPRQKFVVVGAGPVGSLAAIYAAERGYDVELYELRSDLRDPQTTPLNFTKSINLALSERGIKSLEDAQQPALLPQVLSESIAMRGRMIHRRKANGALFEEAQDYDARGRTIFAIDRGRLNEQLLDALDNFENVKTFFNHKLTGADFRKRKAWFEVRNGAPATTRAKEIEVTFDLMIGADGAHSSVRYHMMKYVRMDYLQSYIDTLWCEFKILPKPTTSSDSPRLKFATSPEHLHIWPGKEQMFIAIPSSDGSFVCTAFLPSKQFQILERDPSKVPAFFDEHFPGVTRLISPEDLVHYFQLNPHLPLVSIKCSPFHFSSSAVILGDAAHAMVPFYGQGMNAGLEDVRILFEMLDQHLGSSSKVKTGAEEGNTASTKLLASALAQYSRARVPDAHAINDMALQNYVEMRASVVSPAYRLRKLLEEALSVYLPGLGWQTRYARVSFGTDRYSRVLARSEWQGRVLSRITTGAAVLPLLYGAGVLWWRYRRVLEANLGGLSDWMAAVFGGGGA